MSINRGDNNLRNDDSEESEDSDNEEVNEFKAILDILNLKVVPKQPGDEGYSSLTYIPREDFILTKEICHVREKLKVQNTFHGQELKRANERAESALKEERQNSKRRIKEEETKAKNLEIEKNKLQAQLKDVEEKSEADKNELVLLTQELSAKQRELESAHKQINTLEELKDGIQRVNEEFTRKEEEHRKEKDSLQQVIAERQQKIDEYKDVALERQMDLDNAQKKVRKQLHTLDKEKTNLESEVKELKQSNSELINQVKKATEKWEQCNTELEEAKKIIEAKEKNLREAEGIIREQEKVIDHGKVDKAKLEKLLQTNKNLDATVANLKEDVRKGQSEINRLNHELNHERQQNISTQEKYKNLQDSVVSFSAEFSAVVQDICTFSAIESNQQNGLESSGENDTTVQSRLESLKSHLKNKINWWEENQESIKAEMTKTNTALNALHKILNERKDLKGPTAVAKASAPTLQVDPLQLPSSNPSSSSINGNVEITRLSYKDAAKRSIPSVEISTLSKSPNRTNTLINTENEPVPLSLHFALSSSSNRHGIDLTKRHLGWYCICDNSDFKSRESLMVHLDYLVTKWKYKCSNCSQRFYSKTHLKVHFTKSHKKLKLKCLVCKRSLVFNSWKHLYQHRTFHIVKRCRKHLQSRRQPNQPNIPNSPLETQTASPVLKPIKISFRKISTENSSLSQWNIVSSTNIGDVSVSPIECDSFLQESEGRDAAENAVESQQNQFPLTSADTSNDTRSKQSQGASDSGFKTSPETHTEGSLSPPIISTSSTVLHIKTEPCETNLIAEQDVPFSDGVVKKHGIDRSKKARTGHYCLCGHQSRTSDQLKDHIHTKTADKRFLCSVCNKGFVGTNRLRKHMRSLHHMAYHKKGCRKCGSCFDTMSKLRQHHKAEHPRVIEVIDLSKDGDGSASTTAAVDRSASDKETIPSTSSSKKEHPGSKHTQDKNSKDGFVCCCGVSLPSKHELDQHISTSNYAAKNFECNICNKRYWKLESLHKHLVGIHSVGLNKIRTKDYKGCASCGKLFSNKQLLDQHYEQFHPIRSLTAVTQEEQSMCKSVGNSAMSKSLFTEALGLKPAVSRKKHSVDLSKRNLGFYCVCSVKCKSPTNLQRHISFLNGEGKFKCNLCNYRALFCSQLKFHLKGKHNITNEQQLNNLLIRFESAECGQTENCFRQYLKRTHSSSGEQTIRTTIKKSNKLPKLSPEVSGHIGNASSASSCSVTISPPELSPQVLSSVDVFSPSTSRLLYNEHGIDCANRLGHFCVCRSQFSDFVSLKAHIYNYVVRTGPMSPSRTSAGPSIVVQTGGQGSVHFPISSTSAGSSTPTSSSFHHQQHSPSSSTENQDDMIIDAHLTFEEYQHVRQHGIDHRNASVGHFCLCGSEFFKKQSLNRHVKYHNAKRKFMCRTCRCTFFNVALLRKHLLRVHKIVYSASNGCKDCGKTFPTNMDLYKHFRKDHNRGAMWEQDIKYVPHTPRSSSYSS